LLTHYVNIDSLTKHQRSRSICIDEESKLMNCPVYLFNYA